MIELSNITHQFPGSKWKLNIPDFLIQPSQILGIIGPNGSGKSTLLRISAGILKPSKGTVRLSRTDMTQIKRKQIAKNIGFLPQETGSEYDFTVEELVRMGRYSHTGTFGALDALDLEIVNECLLATEMTDMSQRRLSQLSGGEKKRAFLASVLAQRPHILLLDEPTGFLDVHRQVQFFHLLLNLVQKGMGVVVVTHDVNFASLYCQKLVFLFDGKVISKGKPESVITGEVIHKIYGDDVLLGKHPETGHPFLLPRLLTQKQK
ncbi:MAG: ATP-binding cassette domain-containing protein [Candidatus Aminicenantes bacterium]|nr:ATP-binding cassette domain-containing protein [Candidatus Aminicenantes bacterium]